MKRIFLLLLSVSTYIVSSRATINPATEVMPPFSLRQFGIQEPDTVARDLSDLENAMSESMLAQQQDTTYYGAPRQNDFNALNYVLDSRHRFRGDRYMRGNFWNNTFINFGGGVGGFYHNTNAASFTPTLSLRLAAGKVVSPMVSFRLGLEKTWAYSHASATVFNTNQYNSYGGYVDFLYNFSNYLLGYRPERPFSVSGILGLGVQTAELNSWKNADMTSVGASTSGISVDGHVGVQFKFFASPYASIALEPYFKVGTTKLNLLDNPGYSDPDFSYGINLAYQWNFTKQLSDMVNTGSFWKRFDKDKRYLSDNGQLHHLRFPVFFDYSFGPMYVGRSAGLSLRNTRGFDALAAVGWWLAPAAGVRAGVHVTNGDWKSGTVGGNPAKNLIGTRGVNIDFLFNPFGFTRHYNWDTPFGMNVFTGYEFGGMKKTAASFNGSYEGNYTAFRFGAQLWMKLTNDLRLTLEPTYMQTEHYNGNLDRERYDEYAVKLGLSLLARDKGARNYREVEPDVALNTPRRGFFVGLGFGWNNTVWDWRFTNYQHDAFKNALLFGGYRFSALHSVRLQIEWMKEAQAFFKGIGNDIGKFTYNNGLFSADYQINLFNAMAGYDPLRRWNVYMYAGPTFLFGDGGADFAANIGGMVTYNLSRNLSLFYSHTVYRMPKNRYPHHMVYTRDGIFTNNLNIGVMYSFDAFHDLIARDNNDEPTRRPLFLEYSFGPTFMSKTPISGFKTTGFDSKFLVGWWANSAIGVRSGAHVTNANWNDGHYNNKPVTYLIGTRGALFDLLVNPLGFSSQYNWDSRFGFNLFGGFELGHAKKTNKGFVNTFEGNYHSFRLGGQLWTKLTNDLRVTLEPTFTALKLSAADDNRHNQFSLNVGVAMLMRSRKFRNYDENIPEEKRHNLPLQGFFAGGGLGWNTTVWRWKFSDQKGNLLKNAMVFAGYNFSTLHAVRVQGEYMAEKMLFPNDADLYREHFNNVLVSFDYQLNAINAISGFDPARRWNVYFYAGPSMLMGTGGFNGALNAGGQVGYNLNRNLSLFYSHTVYRMPKARYPHSLPFTKNGTFTNNINIGVMYNFK